MGFALNVSRPKWSLSRTRVCLLDVTIRPMSSRVGAGFHDRRGRLVGTGLCRGLSGRWLGQAAEALRTVIDKGAQRVEAIAVLERRRGVFLFELAQVRGKVCKVLPATHAFQISGWSARVDHGRRCRRGSAPGRCRACRARRR
jgi:hypothetical protein